MDTTFFRLENLLTYQNVLLVVAVWFVIETAKKLFRSFFQTTLGSRLLVLMPMALAQIGVWTTVPWQPASTTGEKVVLGLVLAFLTAHVHDIARRFGFQDLLPVIGQRLGNEDRP